MPKVTVVGNLQRPANQDLRIFRLRKAPSDRETVQRIARRLDMKGVVESGAFCETASTHTYTEAPWSLAVFRESGGWKYRHMNQWQTDDGKANLQIEDAEAIGAAREMIEKMELAPVEDFEPLRVTRLRVATAERGSERSDERVIDVGVAFRRLVSGVRVEGPGGMIVVYMNHERMLTGIDRLWREIETVHEPVKGLHSPEHAVEEVRRRFEQGDDDADRLEVTGLGFGYFEMGWHHEQEFLQPAHVVFLRLISPDDRIRMPSVFVVPAAENSVGEIEPPPTRVTPQARRPEAQT